MIAIKFSKGSSFLEVVDLGRPLKERGGRAIGRYKEKGATHKDSFEAGVSISTWGDRCEGR